MSRVERPTVDVLVAGTTLPGCIEADIALNNELEAGSFRVVLPETELLGELLVGLQGSELPVAIRAAVASDIGVPIASAVLISGAVDRITTDPVRGLVELEGRDLLGRLVDMQVSENFVNQTASEIVAALAARAGLAADIVPTASMVGQFYQLEHARSMLSAYSRFTTAWDVISHLAQTEQCECWADGDELNFAPRGTSAGRLIAIDLDAMRAGRAGVNTLTDLRLDRRVGLDRGVSVNIASWGCRQRTAVNASYPPDGIGDAATQFAFVAPNLADDVALKRAAALYADIVRHRQVVSGTMPGTFSLMPRDLIAVSGSLGGFDGTYTVDSVVWRIDVRNGCTQSFVGHLL